MKRSSKTGRNRRITDDMILWAKERGACSEALRDMQEHPTFKEFFAHPWMGNMYQEWVLSYLYHGHIPVRWIQAKMDSPEEFDVFMDIINEWELR